MYQDDDEENFEGLYEDGHWEWNELNGELIFISDIPENNNRFAATLPAAVGSLDFKDDFDFNQQLRFIKHFQRKTTKEDVVRLQDVIDVALFTTPRVILTNSLIEVLHLQITERFLRSLILYCQYYLQISDEINKRYLEASTKIRTHKSELMEAEFHDNLADLRLLVGKEYCDILLGVNEFSKYHHMGPKRRSHSLLATDRLLYESLVRISIQIIWLALGRKSFNQIEFEVDRIFKSAQFNITEHRTKSKRKEKISLEERRVLLGHCVRQGKKVNTRSPLMNEMLCPRDIDYRLLGLGIVKYPRLPSRLLYFERTLTSSEAEFADSEISLGILGLPRGRFDTFLKEVKDSASTTRSSDPLKVSGKSSFPILPRLGSKKNLSNTRQAKLYPDIKLPKKEKILTLPNHFHDVPDQRQNIDVIMNQKQKWLKCVTKFSGLKYS